jgi:hypothetical protein
MRERSGVWDRRESRPAIEMRMGYAVESANPNGTAFERPERRVDHATRAAWREIHNAAADPGCTGLICRVCDGLRAGLRYGRKP